VGGVEPKEEGYSKNVKALEELKEGIEG